MKTLFICGNNLDKIPTRLSRKKYTSTNNTVDPYCNGFKINSIGKGEFYGWSVDGNERFLLGNFIVTHNSRLENGADGADGRYIFTKQEVYIRDVFPVEDDDYLENIEDDGEPE